MGDNFLQNLWFENIWSDMGSSSDSGISSRSSTSPELGYIPQSQFLVSHKALNKLFIEEKIDYFKQIADNIQSIKDNFLQNYYQIHADIDEMTKQIAARNEARNLELKTALEQIRHEKFLDWDRQLKVGEKAMAWLKDYQRFYEDLDRESLDLLCQEFSQAINFLDAGEITFKTADTTFFNILQNVGKLSQGVTSPHNKNEWKVCRVSPKFIIGSAGGKAGAFCRPWGVCTDPTRRILISDRSNHRIQIFDESGKFLLTFGKEGTQFGEFSRPAGIAVDKKCRIIVADKDNHRIQVFTYSGSFLNAFGSRGSEHGQFIYPWDVAVNYNCDIAVSDSKNHRVQLFTHNGQFLRALEFNVSQVGLRQLDSPRGLAFLPNGNLLVTDFNNHRILLVNQSFTKVYPIGKEGSKPGQFFRPQGITCNSRGEFAVADSKNYRIQVFDKFGNFVREFGSQGNSPGLFDCPQGISFHPNGNLIVVELNNNRVQVF